MTSQKIPIARNAQPRLRQFSASAVFLGSLGPRSTNGMISSTTSRTTIAMTVPQMSGSTPRDAAMMFMPRVQLIG